CNNTRYIDKIDAEGLLYVIRCTCQNKRKIQKELKISGLLEEFSKMTLDSFIAKDKWEIAVKESAYDYLEQSNNDWYMVSGQYGSGKTHICTAVSGQLIAQGKTFFYLPYVSMIPSLANDLKNFFADVKNKAEDLLHTIKNVDVLYIDDFLKTKTHIDLIWQIIDYRYQQKNAITIISSELYYNEMKAIDGALASRIWQRTKQTKYSVEIGRDESRNKRENPVRV
ncbi:MAG TPA: ATP-binding protein, partial [Acholeplasma sp.]|nr:ATP-binding protein [Acholeplasma sp.]